MAELEGDSRDKVRLLMGREGVVEQLGLVKMLLELWGASSFLYSS